MFDKHIDALELLEDLGANMMSFGAVGQTQVEIAYYNGYDIPVDHSSDPPLMKTIPNEAEYGKGNYK
jgi:hypothetical protein